MAQLSHKGTVYSVVMFTPGETSSDLASSWAFLNESRESATHKHSAKEIYFFTKGEGLVKVGNEKVSVKAGDAVYIPSNLLHCARNNGKGDLEYICISFGLSVPSFFVKVLGLLYNSLPFRATSRSMKNVSSIGEHERK